MGSMYGFHAIVSISSLSVSTVLFFLTTIFWKFSKKQFEIIQQKTLDRSQMIVIIFLFHINLQKYKNKN